MFKRVIDLEYTKATKVCKILHGHKHNEIHCFFFFFYNLHFLTNIHMHTNSMAQDGCACSNIRDSC